MPLLELFLLVGNNNEVGVGHRSLESMRDAQSGRIPKVVDAFSVVVDIQVKTRMTSDRETTTTEDSVLTFLVRFDFLAPSFDCGSEKR